MPGANPLTPTPSAAITSSRNGARILAGIYFAGASLLIFVLPYYIPMKHEVYSFSYDFGFNNKVAILGALLSLLAAPFFLGRNSERSKMIDPPQGEPPPSKFPLILMAALHTAGIAFYYLATLMTNRTPDGSYFLSHAINMAHGLRPYKDFEFAYGPALLYPTHWLNMAGLSVHAAYFLFYLGISFVGLYLAWSFAGLLPVRNSVKTLVFLLPCAISIVSLTTVGVSYTIVRFVTPLWVLAKLNEANLRQRPVWQQALIACAGIILVDSISPEIGTVLADTAAIFFAYTYFRPSEKTAPRLIAMIVCLCIHGVLFFVLMPPQFRNSMLAFGQGALNLPVVPSLIDTLYLLCFAYCFKRHISSLYEQNLIFPLVLLFALGTMAGAMTHADAGHVAWDGVGVFVLAVVADGSKPNWSRRILAIAPAVLFAFGTPYMPTVLQLRDAVRAAIFLFPAANSEALVVDAGHLFHFNPERLVQRLQSSSEKVARWQHSSDEEVAFVAGYPSSAAPLYIDYSIQERLAWVNLKPGYYFHLVNAFDPQTVARKVSELQNVDPAILVMQDNDIDILCGTEAEEQTTMRRWLRFPYYVHRKHDSCRIYDPFVAYIRQNYRRLSPDKPFWVNKDFTRTPDAASSLVRTTTSAAE
jgi:hypothetical protein